MKNKHIRKRLYSFLTPLLILAAVNLLFCSKEPPSTGPLPPEILAWGSSPSRIQSLMTEKGWIEVSQTEGRTDYALKLSDDDEKFDPIMDEVVYPYKASFFFNQNRLSIAGFHRTGNSEEIAQFKKEFLAMYSAGSPEWESGISEKKAESGNHYTSSSEIYSGKDILIKIHNNVFTSSQNQIQDEVIDCQIFSVKENEGISVKGLAEL